MNCNTFISYYHSYSITKEGKVYSKYEDKYLQIVQRDNHNEVLFSFGTGKERVTQWLRVDWLVAMHFIPNENNWSFIRHKNGDTLDDSVSNLEWKEFCTDEECKIIKGYRGKYIITPSGNVFNNYTGVIMKPRLIRGYPHVGLRVFNGEISIQKLYKVHRLVAEYFIPNPNNLPQVNHKDENKENNSIENLEWCTNDYNIHYGTKIARTTAKLRCCPSTSKKIFSIDSNGMKKFYNSIGEAARQTGLIHPNIIKVLKGERHTCGGLNWCYAE